MGSSFGKLLAENGFRVITTTNGRSPRTQGLCREARLSVADSLPNLLERSDAVISLVSPAAALQVARNVAELFQGSRRRLLYIDANSISPMTAIQISEELSCAPIDFVDAAFFGLASQLRQRGTLCLSGSRAEELARELAGVITVKIAGEAPGQASAFKMIISGIPKGLVGLFVETMLFAREMALLPEALETCNEIYPALMEVINRMLPTYPQHAARRSQELREVEETMSLNGLEPRVVRAAREITASLARINWATTVEPRHWTIAEIIEQVHRGTVHTPGATPGHSSEALA